MNYKYLFIGLLCATIISFCFASWIIVFDWQKNEKCLMDPSAYDYALEWEINNCQEGVQCIAGPSCSSVLKGFQDVYSLQENGFSTSVPLQNITTLFIERIPSTFQMCCSNLDTCQVLTIYYSWNSYEKKIGSSCLCYWIPNHNLFG
jgi:hypothetical protein